AQLDKLLDRAPRHLAQDSKLVDRVGFLVVIRRGLADPFEKTPLADDRNAKGGSAAELVGGATIVQQRPSKLANNEDSRALCDRRARSSATLPNNVERFRTAHAREPSREGDRGCECRAVEFRGHHDLPGSLLVGPLFSRPARWGAGGGRLLFLCIDAGT